MWVAPIRDVVPPMAALLETKGYKHIKEQLLHASNLRHRAVLRSEVTPVEAQSRQQNKKPSCREAMVRRPLKGTRVAPKCFHVRRAVHILN